MVLLTDFPFLSEPSPRSILVAERAHVQPISRASERSYVSDAADPDPFVAPVSHRRAPQHGSPRFTVRRDTHGVMDENGSDISDIVFVFISLFRVGFGHG